MPVLAVGPFAFLIYLVAFGLVAVGGGIWGLVWLARQQAEKRLSGGGTPPEQRIASGEYPAWRAGEDLMRYPDRLAELERRLVESHDAARAQAQHLRARGERVGAKDDRDALAERYAGDAAALDRRADGMQRVMGLVWRTRAVLLLRAHVAVTARARPRLEALPEGDIPVDELPAAAEAYEQAATAVRDFVVSVESRLADLSVAVPRAPHQAELGDEDRQIVDDELASARTTYTDLQNRMDRLADTLSYLADRCLTREVVEAARVGVDGAPGTADLVDEVGDALRALEGLTELGDQQLADSAMDNLAEDISQLEQAGLEARAEADAALEVARLLEQFPG